MRSKIILIMALLMGLITTVLFFNYMKKLEPAEAALANMKTIVVAEQAIKKNQLLSSGMVKLKEVPAEAVHPDTLLDAAAVGGTYATADIAAGEPILSGRISTSKEESLFLSRKVREGYRAVGVSVNFIGSISNLIEPGDKVDVVYTFENKATEELESVILLREVPVLSIGRRMIEATEETPYVEYSSTALELKPEEAVKLVEADERGTISLLLHTRLQPEAP